MSCLHLFYRISVGCFRVWGNQISLYDFFWSVIDFIGGGVDELPRWLIGLSLSWLLFSRKRFQIVVTLVGGFIKEFARWAVSSIRGEIFNSIQGFFSEVGFVGGVSIELT